MFIYCLALFKSVDSYRLQLSVKIHTHTLYYIEVLRGTEMDNCTDQSTEIYPYSSPSPLAQSIITSSNKLLKDYASFAFRLKD